MTEHPENDSKPPQSRLVWGDCENEELDEWLVGNREGLTRLKEACDVALKEGHCATSDLGEIEGVKFKESGWGEDEVEEKYSKLMAFGCTVFVFALFALLVIGIRQVIHWTIV